MPVLSPLDSHLATAIAALLLGAIVVGLLVRALPKIYKTTLLSAWCWSLAAVIGLGSVCLAAVAIGPAQSDALSAIRFAVAALTFCPIVSVMGSKRPQHRAWNFIVLSLWGVVTLPAFELLLIQRGQHMEVNDARGWFLWLLLLLLPVNYVPTRYWLASLAITAGQFLLLAEHLPLVRWQSGLDETVPILLVTIGAVSAFLVSRREARAVGRFDSLWLDFRDSFGLLWALRVQERVNAFLSQQEWTFELTWGGFRNRETDSAVLDLPAESERMLRQTLSGLLRRFVAPDWIAARSTDDLN